MVRARGDGRGRLREVSGVGWSVTPDVGVGRRVWGVRVGLLAKWILPCSNLRVLGLGSSI